MEDWSLQQEQGRLDGLSSDNLAEMAENTGLHRIKCRLCFRAVTRDHVERDLRVENIFWQRLKREQIHGLLVQFVHASLAVLGGWFECGRDGALDRGCFVCTQEQ